MSENKNPSLLRSNILHEIVHLWPASISSSFNSSILGGH